MGENFPAVPRCFFPRINGDHNRLRAKFIARFFHQLWVGHGRSIDADFIRARIQQASHIAHLTHAAADGERNKYLLGHALDNVENQAALIRARRDVKKRDFIRAFIVILFRDFNRIACIAQIDEINAFDDATRVDIEAGDDAFG